MFGKRKKDRKPLDRYFEDAEAWETQMFKHANRRARLAGLLMFGNLACTVVMAGAIATILPLKQLEPVVIVADRTTGFLEVSRPVAQAEALQSDEAITMANVVRYVRAREGYNIHDVKENFHMAKVLSAGRIAQELEATYASYSDANPVRVYGANTAVNVHIKSVQFPNEKTAVVRFSTDTKGPSGVQTDHYSSIVRFAYSGEPLKNEWRFDNPLGFAVLDYRRDQELVREQKVAGL